MAMKDFTEKMLEDYNDVFADIMNVYLFGGEKVIREDSLSMDRTATVYRYRDELYQQDRDVAKFWSDENVTLSLLGIENQSTVDKDMPLRIMGYDGASYRSQLHLVKKKNGDYRRNRNPRYPVISLVLYFGDRPWKKPQRLSDTVNISPRLANFTNDYRINVMDVRRLPRETVDKFTSDFRFVADYFWHLENNKEYTGNKEQIDHLEELLNFFQYAADNSLFDFPRIDLQGERRPRNMDDVFTLMIKRKAKAEAEVAENTAYNRLTKLFSILLRENDVEALDKLTKDPEYREKLFKKYNI